MLLSVVSGTYNRLPYLQRMIASVRQQMPRHLRYEMVIVDGGSTDGTLEWLESQPNVCLIRHGELRGAIRAFCDGAKMAQGDYVIMANDDVEFHPYSILRALSYIEEHRTCGAVAFADNRALQLGHGNQHRVELMPAVNLDGQPTSVAYAQVGLIRRWLGERVGWWGSDDPIMGKARTYGGDNYLSSRLWELGYSIDAVEGCQIDDMIPQDNLRGLNTQHGRVDSGQYYDRFPRGPRIQPYPKLPNPQVERLRALVMDIHEARLPARTAQERGLAEAMADTALVWHVDYVNEGVDLPAIVSAWQPHLLLTQFHDTDRITADSLRAARAARPDMVIVNWNGDAHEKGLLSPNIMEALREVDLQTVVNAKVLPVYQQKNIRAAYWQIGYKDPAHPYQGEVPAHEVLFLGNCYNDERHALVNAIRSAGFQTGIYGSCPDADGNTHYDFALSRALYERCTIAISDTYPATEGFVSNRLFQAMAAGAFVLQQHSPRLDELTGLKAGRHYIEWITIDDLPALIQEWMQPRRAKARQKIAGAGCAFVREHFSYDAQVRKLWDLLPD